MALAIEKKDCCVLHCDCCDSELLHNGFAHAPYADLPSPASQVDKFDPRDLMKPAGLKSSSSKGRTIPSCRKPELLGILKFTRRRLKNPDYSL
jgi:hypothetical protein